MCEMVYLAFMCPFVSYTMAFQVALFPSFGLLLLANQHMFIISNLGRKLKPGNQNQDESLFRGHVVLRVELIAFGSLHCVGVLN